MGQVSRASAVVLLSGLLGLVLPGTSLARRHDGGKGSAADKAAASKLLTDGVAALTAKDYARAYRTLAESYRLNASSETLFQLGVLAAAEGKAVEAADLMRRYLTETGAEAAQSPTQKEAQRILAQPRPQSGELAVVGERGAFVLADGYLVGVLPLAQPLLLSVGTHRIAIELGDKRQEDQFKVLAGRGGELRFKLNSDVVVATRSPALILLPEYRGVPSEAQSTLFAAVDQAAKQRKYTVQSREAALVQAPKAASCLDTAACQEELAKGNEVGYLLRVRVEGSSAQTKLGVELIDVAVGEAAATVEGSCDGCKPEDTAARLGELTAQVLKEGLDRPRGLLAVQSTPDGADVYLGQRKAGTTPFKRNVFVGVYELKVQKSGLAPYEKSVQIDPGQKTPLEVTLKPQEAQVAEPGPAQVPGKQPEGPGTTTPKERLGRPVWRIALGSVLIAGGVAAAGFGISAMSVNEQCITMPDCTRLYDTQSVGAGLLAGGLVLAAGGVVLIALPGPKPKQVSLRGGSGLGLRLSF